MIRTFLCFLLLNLAPVLIHSEPPRKIPAELWNAFTLSNSIPVSYSYFDNTYTEPKFFTTEMLQEFIQKANRREWNYYGETDSFLYQALDEIADEIRGKEIGVIGSAVPWYEGILLAYGAYPVVIEYNSIVTDDPNVTYLTPDQYWQDPKKFDLILSISSTEHDGLGRYGDPIDPDGDLKAMESFKKMLNPNGKLLLAVPIGPDELVWNAHRIYGRKRLKLLLRGWKLLKHYGLNAKFLDRDPGYHYQPVFLLKPIGE